MRGTGRWSEAAADLKRAFETSRALGENKAAASAAFEQASLLLWLGADHAEIAEIRRGVDGVHPVTPTTFRGPVLVRSGMLLLAPPK